MANFNNKFRRAMRTLGRFLWRSLLWVLVLSPGWGSFFTFRHFFADRLFGTTVGVFFSLGVWSVFALCVTFAAMLRQSVREWRKEKEGADPPG